MKNRKNIKKLLRKFGGYLSLRWLNRKASIAQRVKNTELNQQKAKLKKVKADGN